MKKIILLFSILMGLNTHAAFIPTLCAMKIAGRCFTRTTIEADTFKILIAQAASTNNSCFFESISQTCYVVPADTQLRILAYVVDNPAGASNFYYTDDSIGTNTATVGTNPVYMMADTTVGYISANGGVTSITEYLADIVVPTGKYPNTNGVTTNNYTWTIFAIEESTL